MTLTSPSLAGYDSAAAFLSAVQRDSQAIFAYHQVILRANSEMSTAGSTLQATVESLTAEVSNLRNMYNKVQGANEVMMSMLGNHSSSPRLSPKHLDLDKFSGKRDDLTRFITQMKVKIHQNKDHFAVANSDIFYAVSRLEGDAMAQVQPLIKSESEVDLKSMTEFFNLLQLAFGDLDKKGTAQRAIRSLRQTNRDFHEYLADFQRHIPDTNYDEEAKLAALIEGLSAELKSMLQFISILATYTEAIKTLQELKNKRKMFGTPVPRAAPRYSLLPANLAARSSLGSTRNSSLAPSSAYAPAASSISPQSNASNVSYFNPIDLSTSRPRGPLTDAEKERRVAEGLCLYCGKEGHIVRNYPHSHKKPSRLNEMTTTSSARPPALQESENS